MSLALSLKRIGDRCRDYFDTAIPKGEKIATLQEVLELSSASAEQIAAGRPPTTAHLLKLREHFGQDFIDYVFEREARVGRLLKAVREERRSYANTGADAARGDRGHGGRGELAPSPAGAAASGLITVRRPLSCLGDLGCSHLKDRLSRFSGRINNVERAVDLAKADPLKRTGIAVRDGSSWRLAYIAQANGLTPQIMTGRSLSELPDRAYVQNLTRSFEEAAASPEPIITDTAGAVLTVKGEIVLTHARIARAVVGNVLMACFAPMAQRQATG